MKEKKGDREMTTWEEEITRAHPLLLCMPRSGWEATVIFYGWLPLPPKEGLR